jgi:hypothetical protein
MKNIAVVFLLVLVIHPSFGDFEPTTKRFGVFIGANNGGRDRVTLRYALSDAQAVAQIFAEMGGIRAEDRMVLLDPSIADIDRQLTLLNQRLNEAKETYKRTELIFYYSGHSDEEGLLLNQQRYAYRDLRARINSLPSDMRIVILDSCASGAFTRAKGGVKTLPFLIDESISA